MLDFLRNTLDLSLDSAPWLLLGLLAAGLLKAWLPLDLVGRRLGGSGLADVSRAALLGAPLPLCSCGVLPAGLALRRSGASKASTTAFLISTPETSIDSVAISWALLGPVLALLRPVAALVSALTAGLLVGRIERAEPPAVTLPVLNVCTTGCGCDTPADVPAPAGAVARTLAGLRYAFVDLLDDIALWLAVGLVAAGLVVTLVPPAMLAGWGSGLGAMLLMLAISVPMYVCATASTPLGHAMLWAGVSPGTVLVFLLAGPASNLAGLALVRREFGDRALAAYLVGVAGVSLLAGLGLDLVLAALGWDLRDGLSSAADAGSHGVLVSLAWVSLLLLVLFAVRPLRRLVLREPATASCCGSCDS